VDGALTSADDTVPYEATWSGAAGSHTFFAIAQDDGGLAETSTPVTVTVKTAAASLNYLAGDFDQHTTFTDGSYSFGYQMARDNEFGLDWWANSEHGGGFDRDGRRSGLLPDPLNATVYWDAEPGVTILGNNLSTNTTGHTTCGGGSCCATTRSRH